MTDQEKIEFLAKYQNNPIKFIEDFNYGFSVKDFAIKKLKLFDFQKEIITHIKENKFPTILKSRQMFGTTLLAAYVAWFLVTNVNKTVLFLGQKQASAKIFKVKVIEIIKNLPKGIINIKKDNKFFLETMEGCRFKSKAAKIDATRAENIDLLIFDEFDFYESQKDLWHSTAVVANALKEQKLIIITSLNTKKTYFQELCKEGLEGKNELKVLKIEWYKNPLLSKDLKIEKRNGEETYTNRWYEEMCKRLEYNQSSINSELDVKFAEEQMTVKKEDKITIRLEKKLTDKIKRKIGERVLMTDEPYTISDYIRELIEKDKD